MNLIVLLALIPLVWRLLVAFLPSHWIESYAYWDPAELNTAGPDGRVPTWRNSGYWATGNETFSEANEALARNLFKLAEPYSKDLVMDVAHGAGDSLLIHLEARPKRLVALTSIPGETANAKNLTTDYMTQHGLATQIDWYTGSASFRPNKDYDHPLHPMRGFTGGAVDAEIDSESESDSDSEDDDESITPSNPETGPKPYDLITVLDAIYHFPPSRTTYLTSVLPSLRKGGGVLAFTDFIAPPSLSKLPYILIARFLASVFHVPFKNLAGSPSDVKEYKALLEKIGYTNVKIEDWSDHVWLAFAANLRGRGGMWPLVGKAAEMADGAGWKYVAVRAERP